MDDEIWKPIKGYEGYYEVSNRGNVKSLSRQIKIRNGKDALKKEKILKLQKTKNGYLSVMLSKERTFLGFYVHRLVARAFIPNPENKPQIDHIDGSRDNNNVNNLRWCTAKENRNYPIARKRVYESHKGYVPTEESKRKRYESWVRNGKKMNRSLNNGKSKAIEQIDVISKEIIKIYPSMQEVRRQLGYCPSNICLCCKGLRKVGYGYIWKYHN